MKIVEVGPRDGLQNEKHILDIENRYLLIKKLLETGLRNIEIGAFVSPKWVPQMANSDLLLEKLSKENLAEKYKAEFISLVPNQKGLENAKNANSNHIALFIAASETFSNKNTNCSIAKSLENCQEIMSNIDKNTKVRGYISTVFACPYEGKIKPEISYDLIEKLFKMGVYEVSLGDTIGVATFGEVRKYFQNLPKFVDIKKIAGHFHDTYGQAIANICASMEMGVEIFDASVGGLGGCPYAMNASGNVATEDMIYLLENEGINTNINLEKLIETSKWINNILGRDIASKLARIK